MALNNYTIAFRSRNDLQFILEIGGGSGTAVPLKGGAQPFITEEDDNTDIFTPIRTQSGYIRIVDDGKDANGLSFDWKDLIPTTATERPVKLYKSGVVVWQGYVQKQTFSGIIYNNPQEREIPVCCPLSVLQSINVSTDVNVNVVNFFKLIELAFGNLSAMSIGNFYIQGGNDAYVWLKSKFDWNNLLTESDGTVEPRYTYFDALQDMCRFWGFTMRTNGTNVYMTQAGSVSDVKNTLTMSLANIHTVAAGGTAGTVTNGYYDSSSSVQSSDFASTNQEETFIDGFNKATVKADCNKSNVGLSFAPQAVRDQMGNSWAWYGVDGSSTIGYFATTAISQFTTDVMNGQAYSGNGGFGRLQMYSNEEDVEALQLDAIYVFNAYDGDVKASIETVRAHRFGNGTLKIDGDIYLGTIKQANTEGKDSMKMRLGIGPDREHAKWWRIKQTVSTIYETFDAGWISPLGTPPVFNAFPKAGHIGTGTYLYTQPPGVVQPSISNWISFLEIPTTSELEGKIFIDFLGSIDDHEETGLGENLIITNFKISFSRDESVMPLNFSSNTRRARTLATERQSSCEYTDTNLGKNNAQWNADCIFASDNNMEYGLGLLMRDDGQWLKTVIYNSNSIRPEYHLATKVANFWNTRRQIASLEIFSETPWIYTPKTNVSWGPMFHPLSISHDWRDDKVILKMITADVSS